MTSKNRRWLIIHNNVMQKCAKICKVLLSNNVIGYPYYRRRETKPIGVPDSNFYRGVHVVPMTLLRYKGKIKRPSKQGHKKGL